MSKTAFINGKVYVEAGDYRQAVYQEDGIIKVVGTNDEVLAAAKDAEIIDLGGKTLIPGLNDSHMHLLMIGEVLTEPPIGASTSVENMVEICKKFAEENPDMVKNGMHAQGWNQDLFEPGKVRLPNREDLDKISTEYPIMLERVCGHTCAVNSKALEILGITKDTPDDYYVGGTIERFPDGEPNGYFTENSVYEVRKVVPAAGIKEKKEQILTAMKYATEHGLTSVQSNDLGFMVSTAPEMFNIYKDIYDEGKMTVRFRHQVCHMTEEALDEYITTGEWTKRDEYKRFNGWLDLGPLKLFKDGSLGARTATMRHEYLDDPGNYGVEAMSHELMMKLVKTAAANGMQVVTHVIGDDAIEKTNQCYEAVMEDGKNVLRNVLIHCQITDKPLLEYIKKTDSLISYQPVFLECDLYAVEPRCGVELSSTSYATKTAIDLGIHASYGTDSPVEDSNPFANIYSAITRQDLNHKPEGGWNPQECVSVEEAVDAYTIESAYMEFKEDIKGRIKPGYLADMVVCDRDIFTIPKDDVLDVLPSLVMVDGKIVYEKDDLKRV